MVSIRRSFYFVTPALGGVLLLMYMTSQLSPDMEHNQGEDSVRRDGLPVPEIKHKVLMSTLPYSDVKMTTESCVSRPSTQPPLYLDSWHIYNTTKPSRYEVYMYSAFLDDRPRNAQPLIRIMAIARTIKQKTYCQIWYDGVPHPVISEMQVSKNGHGHPIRGVFLEQYYLNCVVKEKHPPPTHVSIVASPCEEPQSLLEIIQPRMNTEHEFGVCVAITFKQIDPYRVIEWFEMNRLLGVTEFNIYCNHVNEASLKPLYYYEKQGLLKLHFVPTPNYEDTFDGNKVSSALSLNDCMYRNIYRYKWMMVIDFDEVITPKTALNYHDLINEIDTRHKLDINRDPGTYIFRNEYFYAGCDRNVPAEDGPRKSLMMRQFRRMPTNGYLYTPKSIHSTLHCEAVFNHYCLHKINGNQAAAHQVDVNSTIATVHHYRNTYSDKNCQALKNKGIEDKTLQKFKDTVSTRYNQVLNDLEL